jgi:hypothetical protein
LGKKFPPIHARNFFDTMSFRQNEIASASALGQRLSMGKLKTAATGSGYLGEVMVHKISRAIGVVDSVVEAQAGWPPQITLKLEDGSLKKGRLSDFREARPEEKKKFSAQTEATPPSGS